MKILSNYFINYECFCDMETFNKNMDKVRVTLIQKLAFLKNDVLTKIYHVSKEKPTLLDGVFDYKNVLEINDNENMENNDLKESNWSF